jgi:predicted DNA-binding protein
MKAIELKMPDELYERLASLASHDHQSVNVFAQQKLEEFARASADFQELVLRAQRGNRKSFESAMASVPNVQPMPGDEI